VRRGVRVTELIAGASAVAGVPHLAGVRTSDGADLRADLVVDAMGRRSRASELLASLGGASLQEQAADSGFAYYTRYFSGPALPALMSPPLTSIGTISVLTMPGDNGTWSVTVFGASGDAPLKQLRDTDCYTRVLRACPLQAHWLDGQPITGVLAMAGIMDRYRRFAVNGAPMVTGFAAVGDAWACTNPSAGRGLSVGLVHSQVLRQTARDYLGGEPVAFAQAFDEGTQRAVAPFYWSQLTADRERQAEMTALREYRPWAPPASPMTGLFNGASHDADLFRAMIETVTCLAPAHEVLERPDLQDKLDRWSREPVPPPLGPDRQRLLSLLSAPA
jgi:flavin-dependent dehydrogenase